MIGQYKGTMSQSARSSESCCNTKCTVLVTWCMLFGLPKLLTCFTFGNVYSYLNTVFHLACFRVAAGGCIGIFLSAFFNAMDVVAEPSSVCVGYMATWCVLLGISIAGLFYFHGVFPPFTASKTFPFVICGWALRDIDIPGYVGMFFGLCWSFSSVVFSSVHYPGVPQPVDWCIPGYQGYYIPKWAWSFTWLLLGAVSTAVFIPPFYVNRAFIKNFSTLYTGEDTSRVQDGVSARAQLLTRDLESSHVASVPFYPSTVSDQLSSRSRNGNAVSFENEEVLMETADD